MVEIEEQVTENPAPARPVFKSVAPGVPAPGDAPQPPSQNGQAPVHGSQPPYIHPEIDSETHVLTVNDFKLAYGKRQTLHGINMKVAAGKVTALIGPSGCG